MQREREGVEVAVGARGVKVVQALSVASALALPPPPPLAAVEESEEVGEREDREEAEKEGEGEELREGAGERLPEGVGLAAGVRECVPRAEVEGVRVGVEDVEAQALAVPGAAEGERVMVGGAVGVA